MTKRKSTGTRLRFKVFHRDGFTCQYCGMTPPEVILHADHIVAVSKGGSNEIDNLITACSKCNLGKHNSDLKDVPKKVAKNIEDVVERYEQLKEFFKYQKKIENLNKEIVTNIEEHWYELFEVNFDPKDRVSIKMFLKTFTPSEVKDAMDKSTKIKHPHYAFKYMCGILHNKKKKMEEESELTDEEWREISESIDSKGNWITEDVKEDFLRKKK